MRPTLGHDAQSYIRSAKPAEDLPSVEIDTSDLTEEVTQPYTILDQAQLGILPTLPPAKEEETLRSRIDPEPFHLWHSTGNFVHNWWLFVAVAVLLVLSMEDSCFR